MTTLNYVSLRYEEKRELIRLNGSFVSEKQNEKIGKKTIYALYGFYVEVYIDSNGHEQYIRVLNSYFDTETELSEILIDLN